MQSTFVEECFANKKFTSPYGRVDPHTIRPIHFYDARCIDQDAPSGYRIQRHVARKMYVSWLGYVRKQPGFENFRRPPLKESHEQENRPRLKEHIPTI